MLYNNYYKLDNGKIWDIEKGLYVDGIPDEASWCRPVGPDGKTADEEGLYFCLKYFGYPLGDLKTDDDLAKEVREKRNALIAETDYMAMPDYPLDDERKAVVLAYRQALRDVPEQAGFPRQIDWPVKP